jgi:hypothetical protein
MRRSFRGGTGRICRGDARATRPESRSLKRIRAESAIHFRPGSDLPSHQKEHSLTYGGYAFFDEIPLNFPKP